MMLLSMLRDRTRGLFASNDIQAPLRADVHYLHIFYLGFSLLNYIVLFLSSWCRERLEEDWVDCAARELSETCLDVPGECDRVPRDPATPGAALVTPGGRCLRLLELRARRRDVK